MKGIAVFSFSFHSIHYARFMVDLLIEGNFPKINKLNELIAMEIFVIKFSGLNGEWTFKLGL